MPKPKNLESRLRLNTSSKNRAYYWIVLCFAFFSGGNTFAEVDAARINAEGFYLQRIGFNGSEWQLLDGVKRFNCARVFNSEAGKDKFLHLKGYDNAGRITYEFTQRHPQFIIYEGQSDYQWLAQGSFDLRFPHIDGLVKVEIESVKDQERKLIATIDTTLAELINVTCKPPVFSPNALPGFSPN